MYEAIKTYSQWLFKHYIMVCSIMNTYLAPKIYILRPAEGSKGLKISSKVQKNILSQNASVITLCNT